MSSLYYHLPRLATAIILAMCLGYAITTLSRLPWWALFFIAGGWVVTSLVFRWGAPLEAHRYRKVWPWSLAPLCLWGLYVYLADSFGHVDLGAVFFHLQAGMADHGGTGRIVAAAVYTACMLGVLTAFTWLIRHDGRWRRVEPLLAITLLVTNPLIFGIGQRSAAVVTDDGGWLDRRYVEPVISPQATPPNLLLLYLESIERTYAEPRFGDAYADLSAIGETGKVFEGIRQIDNTGWTMAGMIASQCGTPLMPAGLLHDRQFEPLSTVVPGVNCLGDLLAEQGYRLSYLGGASTEFAGKGLFYKDHGFDYVYGLKELQPLLEDPEYVNNWGLFDDSLYDFTVDEIARLNAVSEGPWGVVNLTIAGHAPDGYPAQRCLERQGEWDGVDILYSVECSAWLARDLIERLDARGLLDNTVVVLASDHLTMRVSVWDELITMERDNTFILLGEDLNAERIIREASMVDLFPTILEAMGYSLEDSRAGLGVSLLNRDTETLIERHGLASINARLREESALQQRLWEGLAPQRRDNAESDASQVTETPTDQADDVQIMR